MNDGDDVHIQNSIYYPDLFPVVMTHGEFPTNETIHDAMSMPYGMLVTPFIASDEGLSLLQYNPKLQSARSGAGVARCERCGGYINPFCESTAMRWICSLCDTRNSFARNMLRYRHNDMKLLPEMQHLLIDYPLPLRAAGDRAVADASHPPVPKKKRKSTEERRRERTHSKYHCPASERPLVHVFLVQESMPLDCIQAAIDAVSQATSSDADTGLHPDVQVILLTFSNRIGIYRLHRDADSDGESGTDENTTREASSTYLLPACIQYSHFTLDKVAEGNPSSDGGIFDGVDNNDFLSLAASNSHSSSTPSPAGSRQAKVCALSALNEIASFDDVRQPVGTVRQSLRTALSALYDASPSVSSAVSPEGEASGFDLYGAQEVSQSHSLHGPLVMLGPVLEQVVSWIVDLDSTLSTTGGGASSSAPSSSSAPGDSDVGGLMGLLAGLGLVSSTPPPSVNDDEWVIGDNLAELASKRSSSPVDSCTSVQLHMLLSSPQDLVYGSHPSVGVCPRGSQVEGLPQLDPQWVTQLGERCALHGLGVHVWGIAPFEESYSGLQDLLPLVQLTGGQMHRVVLGSDPATERLRFGLNLNRSIATQSADKCLLKLRTSSIVDSTLGASGHMIPDSELPGIFRMAHCSSSLSVGFTLKYNARASGSEDDDVAKYERSHNYSHPRTLVLQIALSYNTLAEQDSDGEEEDALAEEKGKNTSLKGRNSGGEKTSSDEGSDSGDDYDTTDNGRDSRKMNHIDNIENEYNRRVSTILDLQDDYHLVQQNKLIEDKELVNRLGTRLAHSKFRRRADTRGPARFLHARRLVAVRRLRVITVMVECTPKVPRLIKSAQSSTMAIMVVRRAFMLLQSGQLEEGLDYLYNWSEEITVSLCGVIWKHKRQQQKNAVINGEPEDWECGGKSYTGIEYPPSPPEDRVDSVVSEGLSYDKIGRFLQLMYGAIHILHIQKQFLFHMSSSVAGKKRGDLPSAPQNTSFVFSKSWGDSFAEICSLLMTCDHNLAEKVLYPELMAVSASAADGLTVDRTRLLLRREALVTSAQSVFLADCGREVVLYRSISKNVSGGKGLSSLAGSSSSRDKALSQDCSLSLHTLPLPPGVDPTPQVTASATATSAVSGGMVSAAVTAAASLLYPPPPLPPPPPQQDTSAPVVEEAKAKNSVNDHKASVKDPNWLVNDVHRRLYISPNAPRVRVAEAGKLSSSFFSEKLLNDMSHVDGGYKGFTDDIRARVRTRLLEL